MENHSRILPSNQKRILFYQRLLLTLFSILKLALLQLQLPYSFLSSSPTSMLVLTLFPYKNFKLYKWIHPTLSRRHHRPAGDQRILLWRGINHRNWWWQGSYYQPQWHPWLKPMNSSLVDYKYRLDGQKCHESHHRFFKGFNLTKINLKIVWQ